MKRLRFIILGLLAAIIAGVVLATMLHTPAELPVLEGEGGGSLLGQAEPNMKGLVYHQIEGGAKKWTLKAQNGRMEDEGGQLFLDDVELTFYKENGDPVTLRGDEGTYDREKSLVVLRGNVVGQTMEGRKLETDELTYSERKKLVDTDAWVTISGNDFRIKSRGMTIFVPRSFIRFKSQVTSMFIPKGKGAPSGVMMD